MKISNNSKVKIKKSIILTAITQRGGGLGLVVPLPMLCSLFSALLCVLSTGCEERIKPVVTGGLGFDVPAQESWDTKITFTDSGKLTGILRAGHIAIYADRKYTLLDSGITVDFFDEEERHTSVLTARRGDVNDVTHDFQAHGSVVVVSDSGTTLNTEDLFWTNASHKIHTPAYVEITSPKERLQGRGFESHQDLKHYTIFSVTGQAKTNE